MDDNLKRKFPGSDHVRDTAPQFKRVSVSAPKRSGRIIGMDCAPQELSSLSKDLEEAFKNPRFADLILRVGADQFPAHKIILVSRSKVFERMLASNMSESKENIVNLVDVKASTVKAMLQYMYTGNTDEMSIDQGIDLYVAADRYGLLGLKEHCKNFIVKEIDEESICDVAVLGDLHCDEELSKAAKCMLKKNPKRIFESQKWGGFSEEYPGIYSKLIESTMVDLTDGVAQSKCKSTADESLTNIFRLIQRPRIPNPSSSPSSISIPSSEYLNLLMLASQNTLTRNPRIPLIRNRQNPLLRIRQNVPVQVPENPLVQDPVNPPIQDPVNPPIQDPVNPPILNPQIPPIRNRQNPQIQDPENPSIRNPQIPPNRNFESPLIRNPRALPFLIPQIPPIRDPSIPWKALDIIRMLNQNHQNPPIQNHQNPQIQNPENPQIQDPENPQIQDPENPQIQDPENPQI